MSAVLYKAAQNRWAARAALFFMAKKKNKPLRPKARLPKGFQDVGAQDVRQLKRMVDVIGRVYEAYGFEPLETPAFEYTEALGKFLPDSDRPNEGVFSLQDEDDQWMSLRYDMTAPLARHVAENYQFIAKPFRRYTCGPVWRNEKPGPGRFREFTQFDADTVGTENIAADAEICMLAADTMEALGIERGQYVIKVSHRKVLDALLETVGIDPEAEADAGTRLSVLRSLDKIDKFGRDDIARLLGPGRKDSSGDFTPGAGLDEGQIEVILSFVGLEISSLPRDAETNTAGRASGDNKLSNRDTLEMWRGKVGQTERGSAAIEELERALDLWDVGGFESDQIRIDAAVVRGLEYYTGPVFEAELTFEIKNEKGQSVRFGSVGGGGRYDDLVARFTGQRVPATGFSMGVSRLQAALKALGKDEETDALGPVVVLVMDFAEQAKSQKMMQDLRAAGVRAEMYVGTSGMKAQMKYADKRHAPCVVIQGEDERSKGEVQIKDLIEGRQLSKGIEDAKEWRETRPAQFSVPETEMVAAVKGVLARYAG